MPELNSAGRFERQLVSLIVRTGGPRSMAGEDALDNFCLSSDRGGTAIVRLS